MLYIRICTTAADVLKSMTSQLGPAFLHNGSLQYPIANDLSALGRSRLELVVDLVVHALPLSTHTTADTRRLLTLKA